MKLDLSVLEIKYIVNCMLGYDYEWGYIDGDLYVRLQKILAENEREA